MNEFLHGPAEDWQGGWGTVEIPVHAVFHPGQPDHIQAAFEQHPEVHLRGGLRVWDGRFSCVRAQSGEAVRALIACIHHCGLSAYFSRYSSKRIPPSGHVVCGSLEPGERPSRLTVSSRGRTLIFMEFKISELEREPIEFDLQFKPGRSTTEKRRSRAGRWPPWAGPRCCTSIAARRRSWPISGSGGISMENSRFPAPAAWSR